MTSAPPITCFGPDFPFDYPTWITHPSGLARLPDSAKGDEVAVVGAGIAGVVAAHELMKLGLKPVVFESGRMGGRLRSQRFGAADDVIAELGGMRFPRSSAAFYHYVDLLGLETRPFPNPLTPAAPTTVIDLGGETMHAETLADLPVLFREVAGAWAEALETHASFSAMQDAIRAKDPEAVRRLWSDLVEQWDERTFYDFVASAESFKRLTFRHREVFGQVGFGTGGWDSDFPNSMLEILRVVFTAMDDDQHLIVGGAEQVVRRLWAHAPASLEHWEPGTSLDTLHGGAPRPGVAAIARNGVGFTVTDRNGVCRSFPAVLVTTQSWLLTTSIDVDEALFSQDHWMALDRTRYMQSAKTFVMVDRPFWKDIDPETGKPTMGMTLTDRNTRGTYLFDNGEGQPAVICLSYSWEGDAAKVLAKTAAQRAQLALDTLEKIYPSADITSHVIGEPITVSWESDPDFLGAFKGALPGHYRYNRRMYTHFMQEGFSAKQTGIFLAGDDVSWTPGWAEGAVQTALNAVWGIANHFGATTDPANPGPGDVWDERVPFARPN